MKGFPQWFFCPTAIFRAGPEAEKYGEPWDYALVVAFPWLQIVRRLFGLRATAMVWALSTKGGETKLDWSYAVPLFRWIRKLGFKPDWERLS